MMKCPKCGYENRDTARFCHRCGTALTPQKPAGPDLPQQVTKRLTRRLRPERPPSDRSHDTRPLPKASVGFAPLPEGALLHDGRYVVMGVRVTSPPSEKADARARPAAPPNVYVVEDTTPVRTCPNCRTPATDPEEAFCSLCGADLSGIEPSYLRYLVQESADQQAFALEGRLIEKGLDHPGLRLPHDVFAEAPYGPPRHYLVEPEFSPPPATTLTVPQDISTVLEWGVSLAQALDVLHRQHVTLHETGLGYMNHIVLAGKQAQWAHLSAARIAPRAHRPAASDFARDVQGLATALLFLATGQQQINGVTHAQAQLPEHVATTLTRALTAPAKLSASAFATALASALEEVRHPPSVTLVVGYRTDVGQERSLNEDSLLALDIAQVLRSINAPAGLFAVADGMGGHEAGEVASRLAIQTIAQRATSQVLLPATAGESLPDAREWLTATVTTANQRVYEQRRAAGTDMGTTLVVALVIGNTATIANVGDSRAYLLRPNGIVQVSTDHSLVERLVATGQITPEEAVNHPQKNVIYRVIGDKPQVKSDLFEQRLAPGEALLLCSDGLSGMVRDEQIWQIWRAASSPQGACDKLIEVANQAGGEDNITTVIVQAKG